MSTRSTIWIKDGNTFKGIYCHHDGYLSNNGKILNEHYQDKEKAEALISLGAISSLEERIAPDDGESHDFENPAKGVCVAYHRDRGEDLEIYESKTFEGCKKFFEEYNYFFDSDNYEWHCFESVDFFKKLTN